MLFGVNSHGFGQHFLKPTHLKAFPTAAASGVAFSFTPSVSGGSGTLTYSIVGGALSLGLALNAATGAITGTPTAGSLVGLSLKVQDARGQNTQITLNLTVT